MFLRKLVVIFLPLALIALLMLVLPAMSGIPFWSEVLKGAALGVSLGLLLPLTGATKRREPFAGLLWAPMLLLCIALAGQYLWVIGISIPVLSALHTTSSDVILTECAFVAFMAVHLIRTKL